MKKLEKILLIVVILLVGYWLYSLTYSVPSPDTTGAPVATTEQPVVTAPVVKTVAKKTTTTTAPAMPLIVNGVYQIYYQNSGFYPKTLKVNAGTSVRFNNYSSRSMKVVASEPTIDQAHASLVQAKTVGKGMYFDYVFNDTGYFVYKNYDFPNDNGVVTVVR